MKVGDIVQHKPKTIVKGGVQKWGIVIKAPEERDYSGSRRECILALWSYPGVGLRWMPTRWLEVISEAIDDC